MSSRSPSAAELSLLLGAESSADFSHPASEYSFTDLINGLNELVDQGQVNRKQSPNGHYILYNYASIVSAKWTRIMTLARGLVVDPVKEKIVALPFPKFFNHNEHPPAKGYDDHEILSVETKHDGSLGIFFYDEYDNCWCMITRGSFVSPQAGWGQRHLSGVDVSVLDINNTYLFEIICPESKVVVQYESDQLRLLSGYNNISYQELTRPVLEETASLIKTPIVERHDHLNSIDKIKEDLEGMSGFMQEGYVVLLRAPDGTVVRRKFKCKNYNTLHRSKSNLSKKSIFEIMKGSTTPMEDVTKFADTQPEEHTDMIMKWAQEIMSDYTSLIGALEHDLQATSKMEPRILGMTIKNPGDFTFKLPVKCRSLLFAHRKGSDITSKMWNYVNIV